MNWIIKATSFLFKFDQRLEREHNKEFKSKIVNKIFQIVFILWILSMPILVIVGVDHNFFNIMTLAQHLSPSVVSFILLIPFFFVWLKMYQMFKMLVWRLGCMKIFNKEIRLLYKAIKIDKNNDSAYYELGCIYSNLEYFKKAIKQISRAIELNPVNSSAFIMRGCAFRSIGDEINAVNDWKKAKELGYENADIFLYNYDNYK